MFDKLGSELSEIVQARQIKIGSEDAWKLFCEAREIIVGRGKKYSVYRPTKENQTEILAHCLGRTGNLRAPALKIGDRYLIGFTEEMYNTYLC